jgi:hypothetical protein
MTLAEAHEAYQVLLEVARAHPESEELAEDLEDARRELEVLWLHSALGARG